MQTEVRGFYLVKAQIVILGALIPVAFFVGRLTAPKDGASVIMVTDRHKIQIVTSG